MPRSYDQGKDFFIDDLMHCNNLSINISKNSL